MSGVAGAKMGWWADSPRFGANENSKGQSTQHRATIFAFAAPGTNACAGYHIIMKSAVRAVFALASASRFGRRLAALLTACVVAVPLPLGTWPARSYAQNLPNLGDESANVLSPQMERRIGEGYYRELRRDPAYLDDPEVVAYVQELGYRLIAAGPEPAMTVEFFVMKDQQINAFAMLGGFIGVNSGLILAAQAESEMASVMGHEIGHLTQKHIARGASAGQRASIASLVASALCLLAARSNPQGAGVCLTGAQAAQVQSQLAYSRDFEREADRVGLEILNRGGFDVSAMPVFFERLQRAYRVYDSNAPVYVRSHPLTTERIADVQYRAQTLRPRSHADSLTFDLVRAKLRATMDTSVDGTRDAVKFFGAQVAEKTYTNEAAAYFGLSYAKLQARDPAGAEAALARVPKSTVHPMLGVLAARIRQSAGDIPGALKLLRDADRRFPQVRHVRLSLIEGLQLAGLHEEALLLLREQSQLYRNDAKIYELLAKSYSETGKRMAQHQALGEYLVLLGSTAPAIEQFQIARCAGDGDFYQQSIIDARIRTLWELMISERSDQQKTAQEAPQGADNARRRGPLSIVQEAPGRC